MACSQNLKFYLNTDLDFRTYSHISYTSESKNIVFLLFTLFMVENYIYINFFLNIYFLDNEITVFLLSKASTSLFTFQREWFHYYYYLFPQLTTLVM